MSPRKELQRRKGRRIAILLPCALCSLPAILGAPASADTPPGLQARADVQVSIRRIGASDGGVIHDVELQGEAASEAAARDYGFRSMRQVLDIDCTSRRDRVAQMQVFTEHELRGAEAVRRPPGQWAAPSPDAYLADVINAVCHAGTPRELPAVRQRASAPQPGPPQAKPAVLADAGPPPPVHPAPAPTPTPRNPAAVAFARPPRPASVQPPVQLRATAAPMMRAPIAALAIVSGPIAPAPPRPAAGARAWVAQVGASSSAQNARHELDRLEALLGRPGKVEPATVGGRLVYRATVVGFASRKDAGAFCVKVERAAGACWAR